MNKKSKVDYWLTDEGLNKLRELSSSGMKIKDLCKEMGVPQSTVKYWRVNHHEIDRTIICRGHNDIEYEWIEVKGSRESIPRFKRGGKPVFFCIHCKSFVDETKKCKSGYCLDCSKSRSADYYKNNTEKRKMQSIKRYSLERGTKFLYTLDLWKDTLEYFDNRCAYCGVNGVRLEKEHVIPVSSGGGFTKNNVVPSCRKCNMSKFTKEFNEWYITHEGYNAERYEKIKEWTGIKEKTQQLTLL